MKQRFLFLAALCAAMVSFAGCSSDKQTAEVSGSDAVVVYEVNPKLFTKGTAFQDIALRLDDLKDLGVDILWIMPANELGVEKSVNSPYCVKNYLKLNADFGTTEDLKALIQSAHEKDIKVIMDWVANHTSWDNVWMSNPSWYTHDEKGKIIHPAGTNWEDVAELNYDNPEMRAAMIAAMEYWMKETGIDGYRFDHVDGVPQDFWEDVIKDLKALDPDAVLLAETSNIDVTKWGFDMVYAWNFGSTVKRLFHERATAEDLVNQYDRENARLRDGARIMRYTTNHDECAGVSPLKELGGKEGAMAGFVVTSLLTDTPLIYSSQEIGYPEAINFFNFIDVDWNSDPAYTQEFKDYMQAYKASAPSRGGAPVVEKVDGALMVSYPEGGFYAFVNPTNEAVSIAAPEALAKGKATNLMTGKKVSLKKGISLDAYDYLLLEK